MLKLKVVLKLSKHFVRPKYWHIFTIQLLVYLKQMLLESQNSKDCYRDFSNNYSEAKQTQVNTFFYSCVCYCSANFICIVLC